MSSAPSASLRNLFSELEQLFQNETEARVSVSVQAAERTLAERLNQAVRRLRQADNFSEMSGILCDASQPFARSCAVFHVSETRIGGERMRPAGDEAAAHFAALRFETNEAAAFATVVESREPVVALCSPAELSAGLAALWNPAAGEKAHLFPITAEGTTIGVLCASGAVESAALELLAQAASAVLEARQRPTLRTKAAAAPGLVRIEPAGASSPAHAPEWEELSAADRQLHLRAQRFARVQVAEIRLYRAEAVRSGRARRDLYAALQEAIDSGRKSFHERFISASATMPDYFHRELVRSLADDNPAWLGDKYPGPLV
ncbi:MAG TPA: hypothetical protein VMT86_06480 [Bryobacteraceae bacterium]|nr:hypothetical protein [Bryobacteraceae bacterium]